jgi:hypothetical protein
VYQATLLQLSPVEVLFTLLFALLFGFAGGYGGRLAALASVRSQLMAVLQLCDGIDRRVKSFEGQKGQAVKRANREADDEGVRALLEAAATAPHLAPVGNARGAPSAARRASAPPAQQKLHPDVAAALSEEERGVA